MKEHPNNLCKLLRDDEEVRHLFEALAKKQRATGLTAFPLGETLLNDLGCNTKKDFGENLLDLQDRLDRLQSYTRPCWHHFGPIAYIDANTLVMGPQFSGAYDDYVEHARRISGTA